MPAVRTVTVKSSGGDYTSLAAAEAGEQGDLVSLDRQLNIECYALADTTQVTINGWTTDSTRYVDVYAPTGNRHAGVWDTSKYYLELATSGTPGGALTCFEGSVRLRYLQVHNTRSSPPQFNDAIYVDNGGQGGCLIDGCLCRDGYDGITLDSSAGDVARNSVCYGAARAGGFVKGTSSGFGEFDNCTLIGALYGLESTASVNYPKAKNVYAHGGTFDFGSSAGGLVTKTNCMSSDTTATNNSGGGGATNCTNSVAHSTSNFTNVTGGSENYHLVSGSALIDAGVDLSATFTNDFDGTTRSAPFDIGADEYVVIGGGGSAMRSWVF